MNDNYKVVSKPVRKKDAMALLTGKPVYVDDVTPHDCLIVKLLRSPYASAVIEDIDISKAEGVSGIEAVFTYKDVPQERFTTAGQTYPEPSPYDRLILDRIVRAVGDPVAIIAGWDEKSVDKAMKLIKVKYDVKEPVLDFRTAIDNPVLVHPEDNWRSLAPVGADAKRNLVAHEEDSFGDVDKVMAECDETVEGTYHCKANCQAMMETFRTYCEIDTYGRLHIISSTQIVFHVRRIISNALGIPESMIRVTKPRIGGGFGAKQSVVAELFPAFVTWKTKKPSKIIYTRQESQTAGSPRHEMEVKVRLGADKDGHIKALDVYTLSNSGAYGDHGPTTVGLSGHKSIPLYSRSLLAHRFNYDVAYTNLQCAGAFRGYGAPQGIYAVESTVNELAARLGIDPAKLREMNMTREGDIMHAYYGETATSCTLDRCLVRAKEMIGWDEKYPCRKVGEHKIRSVGMAIAMQGSGISAVDVGSATIRLDSGGKFTLIIGAADMGTGCDTILAQMAAECLDCSVDDISVYSADSDISPYDSGSYASSTTYVTGKAVERACTELKEHICNIAADIWNTKASDVSCEDCKVINRLTGEMLSLTDIANKSMCGDNETVEVTVSNSSPVSPPPFMVGMAEVLIDTETGEMNVVDYVGVVDCGTVINDNLARVQAEGGILQGIGMALYEDIHYTEKGRIAEDSFMNYRVPSRLDVGKFRVEFESSFEKSGPFGAKSIGELVIDTPVPAIAHAIFNATGTMLREVPFTPEKILKAINHEK